MLINLPYVGRCVPLRGAERSALCQLGDWHAYILGKKVKGKSNEK